MEPYLPLIWFAMIAFAVFMYVLLDGFVLGIGILFPRFRSEEERDVMMMSVAPIWDGNETWLVLGGASLFGAFPLAYAVVLSALYLPLLVMLIALVFRGVAFEFRFKTKRGRRPWSAAFAFGSIAATFAQGVVLGAFVEGFPLEGRQYVGGMFGWLSPFSLFTGAALIAGYGLLGATWLLIKTEGALRRRAQRTSLRLLLAVIGFIAAISLWVPFLEEDIARRWFSLPNFLYLAPVPFLVGVAALVLRRAVQSGREILPFLMAFALFALSYAGLAISLWPNIVPHEISYQEAAAPPASQAFLLTGTLIVLPAVLAYTAYAYWVFRGKVRGLTDYT